MLLKCAKLQPEYQEEFIERDAGNIDRSHCVVLIGVTGEPFGLNHCGMCGFENCAAMKKPAPTVLLISLI